MKKPILTFALLGSIMTVLFFYIVNQLTSFNYIWFIYPAFAVIWWPLSLFYKERNDYRAFSIVSTILIITFLISTNYISSPTYPWFLYAIFPVIWWPITMYSGRKALTVKYALLVSFCTIMYYSILNLIFCPQYYWAIYPTYLILWWPISLYFARRRQFVEFSIVGSILTTLFFIIVNLISSPQIIWAIYPTFGILWWPLAMYYFGPNRKQGINAK